MCGIWGGGGLAFSRLERGAVIFHKPVCAPSLGYLTLAGYNDFQNLSIRNWLP